MLRHGGRMFSRILVAFAIMAVLPSGARSQTYAEVDSLIAHFIEVRYRSSWLPSDLFRGCPQLTATQEYGFRRLAAIELSRQRENDVARTWMHALRDCGDARLEQWYFDRFDAALRGGYSGHMHAIRIAFSIADSPRIREYLWNRMIDTSLPENERGTAGGLYFMRFAPEERVREYLRAFEIERLPYSMAWGVPAILMRDGHAPALMEGMGRLVRANPALANQPGFNQVVQTADYADQSARHRLAQALEAGLTAAPGSVTPEQRRRLDASIAHLRRPDR
jgi:hypothetical protein